jgi:hypothetical protein
MFSPNSVETAKWFSQLSGVERKHLATANVNAEEEGVSETGGGSVRTSEIPKIPYDAIQKLRMGQMFYRPPDPVTQPFLLASSFLPDPPDREDRRYHRTLIPGTAELKGLNLNVHINATRRKYAPS